MSAFLAGMTEDGRRLLQHLRAAQALALPDKYLHTVLVEAQVNTLVGPELSGADRYALHTALAGAYSRMRGASRKTHAANLLSLAAREAVAERALMEALCALEQAQKICASEVTAENIATLQKLLGKKVEPTSKRRGRTRAKEPRAGKQR